MPACESKFKYTSEKRNDSIELEATVIFCGVDDVLSIKDGNKGEITIDLGGVDKLLKSIINVMVGEWDNNKIRALENAIEFKICAKCKRYGKNCGSTMLNGSCDEFEGPGVTAKNLPTVFETPKWGGIKKI